MIFYTGTRFANERYAAMVDLLLELRIKWDIGVIDLWNSEKMNAVGAEDYEKYMHDPVHPTAEGYRLWWTPEFREYLEKY